MPWECFWAQLAVVVVTHSQQCFSALTCDAIQKQQQEAGNRRLESPSMRCSHVQRQLFSTGFVNIKKVSSCSKMFFILFTSQRFDGYVVSLRMQFISALLRCLWYVTNSQHSAFAALNGCSNVVQISGKCFVFRQGMDIRPFYSRKGHRAHLPPEDISNDSCLREVIRSRCLQPSGEARNIFSG